MPSTIQPTATPEWHTHTLVADAVGSEDCGSGGNDYCGDDAGSGSSSGSVPDVYPVQTDCGTIPSVLRVEVSTGEDFLIVYQPANNMWYGLTGEYLVCPPALSFGVTLHCISSALVLGVIASWRGPASPTPTSVSYSPFVLTYMGLDDGGGACAPTQISLTVSES